MTKKGMLQSVRRTITRLECLNEKFIKDEMSKFVDGEIRKMKIIEETLVNEIKEADLDRERRRQEAKSRSLES